MQQLLNHGNFSFKLEMCIDLKVSIISKTGDLDLDLQARLGL